jgi:hypothetical protein
MPTTSIGDSVSAWSYTSGPKLFAYRGRWISTGAIESVESAHSQHGVRINLASGYQLIIGVPAELDPVEDFIEALRVGAGEGRIK